VASVARLPCLVVRGVVSSICLEQGGAGFDRMAKAVTLAPLVGVMAQPTRLWPLWRSYGLCGCLVGVPVPFALCPPYQRAGAPSVGMFAVTFDWPRAAALAASWFAFVWFLLAPSGGDCTRFRFAKIGGDILAAGAASYAAFDVPIIFARLRD
jgi:hypothetical protein